VAGRSTILTQNEAIEAKRTSQNAIDQPPLVGLRSAPAKDTRAPNIARPTVATIDVSASTHQNQAVGLIGTLARVT